MAQQNIKIMGEFRHKRYYEMEYQEDELREMIANLRLIKTYEDVGGGLQDKSEIELTKFELLLENYLENKLIKSIKL